MLMIFAFMCVCAARAPTDGNMLEARVVELESARQAGEERARKATADLRREVEELKKARQADADLRKQVEEIKRLRRGDADLIAELKKLIQSEIGEMSFCEMGTHLTAKGSTVTQQTGGIGFTETVNIPFGRTFKRIPKVSVSISQFVRIQQKGDPGWGLTVQARGPTTDSFALFLQGYNTKIDSLTAAWIACV